ncbi:hypothetical protein STCU_03872 [Strigomonas culicis]|uniref:Uncharacterized protein n=1 Tax=Strigomonas culicis TaxID=28005 RepID=S9UPJ2_9TRYP|nr:hypothetical protein STCU_03872 [Strigomonas culicis]|eukprot:EPY30828.1 hypothetical protein STCU_03872 [Strigomonas culicis]
MTLINFYSSSFSSLPVSFVYFFFSFWRNHRRMPPKKKLLRRRAAKAGDLNLETAAEERIDAVTCEPLKPGKFIEVVSPDGTLKLFYNTSTLVRVATDKGGFLQPPHFREPMLPSLVKQIEEIEGKKFTFEQTTALNFIDDTEEGGTVHHQHQYFEDIMDEFYILNRAQVYVCPVCYGHYVQTRFIPQMTQQHRQIHYLNEGQTPVVDPLTVLSNMMVERYPPGEHLDDDTEGEEDRSWDNMMVHVVFRNAVQWKAHMKRHHEVTGVAAEEHRLRQLLCLYHTQYNASNEQRYLAEKAEFGYARRKFELNQQRYWQLSAGYNRLRYNRVVQETELAAPHPEAVAQSAFAAEAIAQDLNPVWLNEADAEDFIDDDDDSGDYVPHYSPPSSEEEDEEVEWVPAETRPRRSKRQRSLSSTTSSSAESSSSDTDEEASSSTTSSAHQRQLFKRGLLKEHKPNPLMERMTADERRFVRATERVNYMPTTTALYDPIMHRAGDRRKPSEEIDWSNLGGAMTRRSTVVVKPADAGELTQPPATPEADEASGTPVMKLLLLDEDEDPPDGARPAGRGEEGQQRAGQETARRRRRVTPMHSYDPLLFLQSEK